MHARSLACSHVRTYVRTHARRHAHVCSLVPCAPHARICVSDAGYHNGRCALLPRQSCLQRPRGGASGRTSQAPRSRQGPVCVFCVYTHTYLYKLKTRTEPPAARDEGLLGLKKATASSTRLPICRGRCMTLNVTRTRGGGDRPRALMLQTPRRAQSQHPIEPAAGQSTPRSRARKSFCPT